MSLIINEYAVRDPEMGKYLVLKLNRNTVSTHLKFLHPLQVKIKYSSSHSTNKILLCYAVQGPRHRLCEEQLPPIPVVCIVCHDKHAFSRHVGSEKIFDILKVDMIAFIGREPLT